MNDQATTLRQMATGNSPEMIFETPSFQASQTSPKKQPARTIAITGGKGGVGKTNLAVNLAFELAALQKRVVLLDADLGLANADLLCGINPNYHLGHFFSGDCSLEEVVVELQENVQLIPGGSGVEELANFSIASHALLLAELQEMEKTADFFVIDTAAGIGENVMGVLLAASEVAVVTTPEPTAIVDAYATIKLIFQHDPDKQVGLIVNNVVNLSDAEQVYRQLAAAAERFLKSRLNFLGAVPHDDQLAEAVRLQIPAVKFAPSSPASRSIRLIAKSLNSRTLKAYEAQAFTSQSFWQLLSKSEA